MHQAPVAKWRLERDDGRCRSGGRSDEHIGTEHLLLGLLAEPDGIAARDLAIAEESARRVRQIIESEGYSTPSNRVIFPPDKSSACGRPIAESLSYLVELLAALARH